jgi:hypothetical protein
MAEAGGNNTGFIVSELAPLDPQWDIRRISLSCNDSQRVATSTNRPLLSPVDSPGSHLVDASIAVKRSSGDEPLAVVVGEGVVALVCAFEPRDRDYRHAEVVGDGGQGDALGLSDGPEVAVVVDGAGTGERR